jgi:N utilization substance protein A
MINKDFFAALDELEAEKGIKKETFINALQDALAVAYRKHFAGKNGKVTVEMDEERGSIRFYVTRTVVEELVDKDSEILLEEALDDDPNAKIGDVQREEFVSKDFGRIAAQTAKQIIQQKLRDTERSNTLSEFSDKENEMLSGTVRKVEMRNVYVDIGSGSVEGLLLPQDQTPGERYNVNDPIKVYVKRVKNEGRSSQVLVSRTAPGLVKRLFEEQVPEIKQGVVQVMSISREPGQRTKMAIRSEDPKIDPVGACVGNKGCRVNAVVAELNGEKIDIILWSENPLEFIAKALAPAPVTSVSGNEKDKMALVVVPDDKLSLAIGRDGQNARLAARLTGWKIDVKSETVAKEQHLLPEEEGEEAAESEESPVEE